MLSFLLTTVQLASTTSMINRTVIAYMYINLEEILAPNIVPGRLYYLKVYY